MNKALEQKLIGPMEESHTKEQPPSSFVRGALSKEIENGSKMSLDSGLSWLVMLVGHPLEGSHHGPMRQGAHPGW